MANNKKIIRVSESEFKKMIMESIAETMMNEGFWSSLDIAGLAKFAKTEIIDKNRKNPSGGGSNSGSDTDKLNKAYKRGCKDQESGKTCETYAASLQQNGEDN